MNKAVCRIIQSMNAERAIIFDVYSTYASAYFDICNAREY